MSTPISNSTSYVTPANSLLYVDKRLIGDLITDTGNRDTDPASSATWQALLDAGAGEMETACLVGGRYEPTDLAALTGVMATKRDQLNTWLGCKQAFFRRQPMMDIPPFIIAANDLLEQLRKGERIFGLVEVQEANLATRVGNDTFQSRPLVSFWAQRWFGVLPTNQRGWWW